MPRWPPGNLAATYLVNPRMQFRTLRGELAMEGFGVDTVDDRLVLLGYFAPAAVRPRTLVDALGRRVRVAKRLPRGAYLVGGPEALQLAEPITLEVVP